MTKLPKYPFDSGTDKTAPPLGGSSVSVSDSAPAGLTKCQRAKPGQLELLPNPPDRIEETVPFSRFKDRCFELESHGFVVHTATVIKGGYRLEARRCDCQVCSEGRQARARARQAAQAKAQAERPVSSEQGRKFFEELRRQLTNQNKGKT